MMGALRLFDYRYIIAQSVPYVKHFLALFAFIFVICQIRNIDGELHPLQQYGGITAYRPRPATPLLGVRWFAALTCAF